VTKWRTSLIIILALSLLTPLALPGGAQASGPSTQLRTARVQLSRARAELRQARRELIRALSLRAALKRQSFLLQAASPSATQTADPAQPQPADSSAPQPLVSTTPDPQVTPQATVAATEGATVSTAAVISPTVTNLDVVVLRRVVRRALHRVQELRRQVQRLRWLVAAVDGHGSWMPYIAYVAQRNGISAQSMYTMMLLESGGRTQAVGGGGAYLGLFQYSLSTWHGSWNPWRTHSIFDGAAQIQATAKAIRLGYGPSWWPNTYPRAF